MSESGHSVARRRLCVILPSHWEANMGGSEYQAKILVERVLAQNRFDVHYVARTINLAHKPSGYSIHQIRSGPRFAGAFFPDAPSLWRILTTLAPDVIYQRVGCAYTGVAAHYARRFNRCLVWHVANDADLTPHNSHVSWTFPFEMVDYQLLRYGIRHATTVVVQTLLQDALLRRYHDRDCTAHISNFHPLPTAPTDKPDLPISILWIANIKPQKQPELFIRLARHFRAQRHLRFVMIGSPPATWRSWHEMAADIAELPNLEYLGAQSQEAVNSMLARGHILVNTSLYEGFPNTFIQAWQRRVPVVSLAVDPETSLTNGGCGYCAGNNFEELTRRVLELANNATLRADIGIRAESYAREVYSIGNVDRLIGLLER